MKSKTSFVNRLYSKQCPQSNIHSETQKLSNYNILGVHSFPSMTVTVIQLGTDKLTGCEVFFFAVNSVHTVTLKVKLTNYLIYCIAKIEDLF